MAAKIGPQTSNTAIATNHVAPAKNSMRINVAANPRTNTAMITRPIFVAGDCFTATRFRQKRVSFVKVLGKTMLCCNSWACRSHCSRWS